MAWWEIPVASASPSSVNEANDRAYPIGLGFPGGSGHKESACNVGDPGWIPGSGRSPGERDDNPL